MSPQSRVRPLAFPLFTFSLVGAAAFGGCSSDPAAPLPVSSTVAPTGGTTSEPTLRADITPITEVSQAKTRVFIPPFRDCRIARSGDTGASEGGKVCTNVALSGCTEAGKYYPEYASCDVTRTQRPYYPADAKGKTVDGDPRLADTAFMGELAWVTSQARAAACTCCHDSKQAPQGPSQWFIDAPGIWTDTASDAAIALFAGYADSSFFGAYEPKDNNGFERSDTGLPSTDAPRMRAFFTHELTRRGITEEAARAFPPFGGPLYKAQHSTPTACTKGEGVAPSGVVTWAANATVRYVYILEEGSKNPGVPPNFDLPQGTIWRLDVLASSDPLGGGLVYGETPPGTFQAFPATGRAPALVPGRAYQIFVFRDVGISATSCVFTYSAK